MSLEMLMPPLSSIMPPSCLFEVLSTAMSTPIKYVSELETFTQCLTLDDFLGEHGVGGYGVTLIDASLDSGEQYDAYVTGRAHGSPVPDWMLAGGSQYHGGLDLYRISNAFIATRYGAICESTGGLPSIPVDEAKYFTPDFSALPFAKFDAISGGLLLDHDSAKLHVERCSVFLSWGGIFNYGHFLIDCISSLVALRDAGVLDKFPAVVPNGLKPWHEYLLSRVVEERMLLRVSADVAFSGQVVYASPMAHFLHKPNNLLRKVRECLVTPETSGGSKRLIYLSRSGDRKRYLINESDLERRLVQVGFEIVHPERLGVEDQIKLFANSSVIVGATGAAFANCIFADPGTEVIEIQPSNFMGRWVPLLCSEVGVDWHIFFSHAPIQKRTFDIGGVEHDNIEFTWEVDIDALMRVVLSRLHFSREGTRT